jgi:hypothetical protein
MGRTNRDKDVAELFLLNPCFVDTYILGNIISLG